DFIDSDDELLKLWQKRFPDAKEKTVRDIYRTLGETEFRRLEADTLLEISRRSGAQITALGGGALSNSFVTPEILSGLGSIIWIDVPDEVAWKRVAAGGLPPFLSNAADPEAEFIRSNAARKAVFKKYAALKISPTPEDSPRDTALRILAALENMQ
ncbi:MAG: hypothetical protein IKB74_02095, partial [Lentisphaeria bacterium]|nr:hypothetical protein [Lentisphaeria bacterium]